MALNGKQLRCFFAHLEQLRAKGGMPLPSSNPRPLTGTVKVFGEKAVNKPKLLEMPPGYAPFFRLFHFFQNPLDMHRSRLPTLGGHLKTGHTWSLQNRPTKLTQNKSNYT
jgi:hypothetical protein